MEFVAYTLAFVGMSYLLIVYVETIALIWESQFPRRWN
jgi:hypothetical protein